MCGAVTRAINVAKIIFRTRRDFLSCTPGVDDDVCHVPEGVQGARRPVPGARHTRRAGRVPPGAGETRAGPVALVPGGRRHREHDDVREAAGRRRGRADRRLRRELRLRPGAAPAARRRAGHRRGALHQVLLAGQEQRGPAAVRRTRRPRQPGAGEEGVRRHLEHVDQELLQGPRAPAEPVQLLDRSVDNLRDAHLSDTVNVLFQFQRHLFV